MYSVAVQRSFIAQHYLIGGDWGVENQRHSHPYRIELILSGQKLDLHGYLADIMAIENALDEQLNYYRDQTLNDLPEFFGINPSIEHFARILCERLSMQIRAENVCRITVKLWEHKQAWASYEMER